MADSPQKTAELNSYSIGSLLGNIWDTTTNTFTAAVKNVENAFIGGVTQAAAQATVDAQNSRQAGYSGIPVNVQGGLDRTTMLFLGAGLMVFLLKRK